LHNQSLANISEISLEKLHTVRLQAYVKYKARQYFVQSTPRKATA